MKKHWVNPNFQNSEPMKRTVSISATGSALKRELNFCNGYLSLVYCCICINSSFFHFLMYQMHISNHFSLQYSSLRIHRLASCLHLFTGMVAGYFFFLSENFRSIKCINLTNSVRSCGNSRPVQTSK